MKNFSIEVRPGSLKAVRQAFDLFGKERVDRGSWDSPVWVFGLSPQEVEIARKKLQDSRTKVRVLETATAA